MSRYIDADALMSECKEELKDESLWHDEDTTKDYAEGHDDGKRIIMNIIDSAPSIDIPQWIPCSERLPKTEEKVWIQTERGKVCFAMYEDGTISEDDSAWHWYDIPFDKWDQENDCGIIPEGWWEWTEFHPDNEFDCPVDEVVVAWMLLPKPWKGADDDRND